VSIWTGLATYFIIWWLTLFAVLPWGAKPPENPEPGMATSAPERPRILVKFAVNTGLAAAIYALLWVLIEFDVINPFNFN
jgi:predicted secreted protein